MLRKFRDIAPFIMLGYSFLFAISSYFSFYANWFKYLADTLGYSIFTNIVLLSLYLNVKYCNSTRVAVIGLISLNIFNLLWLCLGVDGTVYDIFIIIIISLISVIYKFNI